LEGGWARGSIQKIWDPYLYLQPLKLATSNLVHKLCLGLDYQKQRLGPTLALVGSLLEYFRPVWCKKARMLGVPDGAKTVTMCITV